MADNEIYLIENGEYVRWDNEGERVIIENDIEEERDASIVVYLLKQ